MRSRTPKRARELQVFHAAQHRRHLGTDPGFSHLGDAGEQSSDGRAVGARVDHARAGTVSAADPFIDRLDDLVAVAELFGDQRQNDQAKIAVLEEAARPPAAVASATYIVRTAGKAATFRTTTTVAITVFESQVRFLRVCFDIAESKIYRNLDVYKYDRLSEKKRSRRLHFREDASEGYTLPL